MGKIRRIIFHVDMDSFYASCELSRRPELKGKPFIVGADPKGGKGRGVVIACNYEARKFGIRSATPISKAWQLCPNAFFVRPDFPFYEEISEKVIALIRQFADKVEQVSIDEAYLDVSSRISVLIDEFGSEEKAISELANSIKKSVRENEGITCSIGVANSKIVAKIATDLHKPDGLTIVPEDQNIQFLNTLSIGKIPGVGKVTEGILKTEFKVQTIQDIRSVPIDDLRKRFGKWAMWLLNVANGFDKSEVVPSWDPVSISGETTFEEDEADYEKVKDVMFQVAGTVQRRATIGHYRFRTAGIKIRFQGFETHTRSRSLKSPTDSLDILNKECERQLLEFARAAKPVRLIGVRVSTLEKTQEDQLLLSEWSKTGSEEASGP